LEIGLIVDPTFNFPDSEAGGGYFPTSAPKRYRKQQEHYGKGNFQAPPEVKRLLWGGKFWKQVGFM